MKVEFEWQDGDNRVAYLKDHLGMTANELFKDMCDDVIDVWFDAHTKNDEDSHPENDGMDARDLTRDIAEEVHREMTIDQERS